jgi:hypothetical protein
VSEFEFPESSPPRFALPGHEWMPMAQPAGQIKGIVQRFDVDLHGLGRGPVITPQFHEVEHMLVVDLAHRLVRQAVELSEEHLAGMTIASIGGGIGLASEPGLEELPGGYHLYFLGTGGAHNAIHNIPHIIGRELFILGPKPRLVQFQRNFKRPGTIHGALIRGGRLDWDAGGHSGPIPIWLGIAGDPVTTAPMFSDTCHG